MCNVPPIVAACLAVTAGRWKPGRTAAMISMRCVTAASAAATTHASRLGAATPLMSLRFSSGTSVTSKPEDSAKRASSAA